MKGENGGLKRIGIKPRPNSTCNFKQKAGWLKGKKIPDRQRSATRKPNDGWEKCPR